MSFAIGSLVKARGREWVVLPESRDELLVLRPLGGTDDEIAGVLTSLEEVGPATFALPDPTEVGDYRSGRLLRDALRLGVRWSAGPFRSFGRIAVEPRPYQLVPLLMALKLDPVRLLIADDVGIGKTIEACLVARELIDRGECQRLAVLCPPHLAEQWQRELDEKFHLETKLVLASTVRRLERQCRPGESLFERYPRVVVSVDYIKSDRRRDEFVRGCPELVIVDEAHTCAYDEVQSRSRHQRHALIKALTDTPGRHMIFVTATPHSGKEGAFRSLLSFLRRDFANLPEDMTGAHNAKVRRSVAAHLIQRRRADIRHYMDDETIFPEREDLEANYKLSAEYRRLFERVLNFARETVRGKDGGRHRQRIRWWSAMALLRSLASSPAAAAETLRNRSAAVDTATPEEADEVGRRQVLDLEDSDSVDAMDVIPGGYPGEEEGSDVEDLPRVADTGGRYAGGPEGGAIKRRLQDLARTAESLRGEKDEKLLQMTKRIAKLISDGYNPIIFCRFIPTAEYVAEELRHRLGKKVSVAAVTSTLPPAEREKRVEQLAEEHPRVLVCTDCLSEGINLQHAFNAVVHYDLSWNPTRHEQREGRADRFGQSSPRVRALTYFGVDNGIDGMVLDVLLRKHRQIRNSLGISVPVPVDTSAVVEAVFEGLLMGGSTTLDQTSFDFVNEKREQLHEEWQDVTERQKRSRTMFAQEGIKVDEVARELSDVRQAIGGGAEVSSFIKQAVSLNGGFVEEKTGFLRFDLSESPRALIEACGGREEFRARFELPVGSGVLYLSRTHPFVEGMAEFVMNSALDAGSETKTRRCGAILTRGVSEPTTLLLARFRYHLSRRNGGTKELLAEDAQPIAFAGEAGSPRWLEAAKIDALLQAKPAANLSPDEQAAHVRRAIDQFGRLRPALDRIAEERSVELLDAHKRVRASARAKHVTYKVKPELPADVLGIYIFLPKE